MQQEPHTGFSYMACLLSLDRYCIAQCILQPSGSCYLVDLQHILTATKRCDMQAILHQAAVALSCLEALSYISFQGYWKKELRADSS